MSILEQAEKGTGAFKDGKFSGKGAYVATYNSPEDYNAICKAVLARWATHHPKATKNANQEFFVAELELVSGDLWAASKGGPVEKCIPGDRVTVFQGVYPGKALENSLQDVCDFTAAITGERASDIAAHPTKIAELLADDGAEYEGNLVHVAPKPGSGKYRNLQMTAVEAEKPAKTKK